MTTDTSDLDRVFRFSGFEGWKSIFLPAHHHTRGTQGPDMCFTSSIVLFTIVASLASTSLGFHQLLPPSSPQSIFSRQVSDPCSQSCNSANKAVKTCKTTSCVCTASNAASLQSCITCILMYDSNSASDVADAQQILSSFNTGCASFAGVPSLTFLSPASSTSPAPGSTHTTSLSQTTTPVTASTNHSTTYLSTTTALITVTVGTFSASTNVSATGGLPASSSATRNEMVLHGTGTLCGLVLGIVLMV